MSQLESTPISRNALRRLQLVLLGLPLCLQAGVSEESTELTALTLEELLQVKISVASTQAETITKTPAVVSRFSRADLQAMGITRLEDIVSFIPGVTVQDTAIGTKAIMVRGLTEAFNQKILFLLNGVPYWQQTHSDVPLLGIPFEAIDRIEVIRGPGAVFYGTNASAGVINVVTRTQIASDLFVSLGANKEMMGSFYSRTQLSDELNLQLSAQYRDSDGFNGFFNHRPVPGFYPPNTPSEADILRQESDQSILAELEWQNYKVTLHQFESQTTGLAAVASTINQSELNYQGRLAAVHGGWNDASHRHKLNLEYNQFDLNIPTANLFAGTTDGIQTFAKGGNDNYRQRAEYIYEYVGWQETTFLIGAEFEHRQWQDYQNKTVDTGLVMATAMQADSTDEFSVFSQFDIQKDSDRWVIGGRLVDNEKAGNEFLPRISWVRILDESSSFKILYSTGFNSPNAIQQGINIPPNVIRGDENLAAEKVSTLDIAYTWNQDNRLLVVNAYYLEADDFIFRESQDFQVVFANTEKFLRTGLELDYQQVDQYKTLFANFAYHHQGNGKSESDFSQMFAPRIIANVGASWRLGDYHQLGASWMYQSERGVSEEQHRVNLNYRYTLNNWQWYLNIENLFGEDLNHPDVQDFNPLRLVPGDDDKPLWQIGFRWQISSDE